MMFFATENLIRHILDRYDTGRGTLYQTRGDDDNVVEIAVEVVDYLTANGVDCEAEIICPDGTPELLLSYYDGDNSPVLRRYRLEAC
jgi:hypothetical protein